MDQGLWLIDTAHRLYRSFTNAKAEVPPEVAQDYITVLSRYPVEVIEAIFDPWDGIHADCNWVPGGKELRDCCNKHNERFKRRREQEDRERRQLAEREAEDRRLAGQKGDKVKAYLAKRKADNGGAEIGAAPMEGALPPEALLGRYLHHKAMFPRVTPSPEAAAIMEAAGIDWRGAKAVSIPKPGLMPKPPLDPLSEQDTSLSMDDWMAKRGYSK